jgi:hypothetical protein
VTIQNWITIAFFGFSVVLLVYGFIYRLDRRVMIVEGRCVMHQPIIDSIASLNSRLDKVANDNEIFWKVIGPHLEDIIHSPKSVDRDELVDKLTHGTIKKDELPVLIDLLHDAIEKPDWTSEKRFAGVLLLARATALFNDDRYERRRPA